MSATPDISRIIMALPQLDTHELWRLSDAASKELTQRPLPDVSIRLAALLTRNRTPIEWEGLTKPAKPTQGKPQLRLVK